MARGELRADKHGIGTGDQRNVQIGQSLCARRYPVTDCMIPDGADQAKERGAVDFRPRDVDIGVGAGVDVALGGREIDVAAGLK